MLTRKHFEQLQKTTGFNLDLLEKTYHLTRILKTLKEHSVLKNTLILKGGTALNFLYFPLPRLSVDIDLDYRGAPFKETMLKQRQAIDKKIPDLSTPLGYTCKDRGSSYIISRHSLHYTTIRNTKDHIKIEINYLYRIPLGPIENKIFPSFFPDIQPFAVPTYSLEELTAQKTIAYLNRSEPRDLYDLYLLSQQKISREKTRTYAAIYHCMTTDNDTDDSSKITSLNTKKIQQELQQFIRPSEKLDPTVMSKKASQFAEQIIKFNKNQQQFIKTFYKEKKISAALLDIDETKILQHPALLHKING